MAEIRFTWDDAKARSNLRKHRVSFDEAQTAFYDDDALLIDDPDHSEREDRFILLGVSATARVLLVVHSYRDDDNTIRLISARKANSKERSTYEQRKRR